MVIVLRVCTGSKWARVPVVCKWRNERSKVWIGWIEMKRGNSLRRRGGKLAIDRATGRLYLARISLLYFCRQASRTRLKKLVARSKVSCRQGGLAWLCFTFTKPLVIVHIHCNILLTCLIIIEAKRAKWPLIFTGAESISLDQLKLSEHRET